MVNSPDHGNELLDLMKGDDFLDVLNTYQLIKVFISRLISAINEDQD
jgi:hypothetical protein